MGPKKGKKERQNLPQSSKEEQPYVKLRRDAHGEKICAGRKKQRGAAAKAGRETS